MEPMWTKKAIPIMIGGRNNDMCKSKMPKTKNDLLLNDCGKFFDVIANEVKGKCKGAV